jgi:transcription initiation factor IIE alpha subunit
MTQDEGFHRSREDRESLYGKDVDDTHYRLFKTIARISTLTANQKILLVGIMSFNEGNGTCFMTNATMCYEFGMSLNTVKKCLDELKSIGLITLYSRFDNRTNKTVGRVIRCNNKEILKEYTKSMSNYTEVSLDKIDDSFDVTELPLN